MCSVDSTEKRESWEVLSSYGDRSYWQLLCFPFCTGRILIPEGHHFTVKILKTIQLQDSQQPGGS
jgi:hypothetical protein